MKRLALIAIIALSVSASAYAQQRATPAYANLPLNFEQNVGQTDSQAQFISHGKGYTLFLSPNQAIFEFHTSTFPVMDKSAEKKLGKRFFAERAMKSTRKTEIVRMNVLGANPGAQLVGVNRMPGTANYFIGRDPSKWRSGVPIFANVQTSEVLPGIDLVYYGNEKRLEYDFVVKPGADPNAISLGFDGIRSTSIDGSGNLSMTTETGSMALNKPVIYQMIGGQKKLIQGQYALRGANSVGVSVASYDRTQPLIVDPVLTYSTYLGGSGNDGISGVAVDSGGEAYVVGWTDSTDFPVVGTSLTPPPSGTQVAFVSKFNSTGTALIYSTYLGGNGGEWGNAIALDANGAAYVVGQTGSSNFPVTSNAYQTSFGSGASQNAFVSKLSADGQALLYSTYLGGGSYDQGIGIAVDANQNAYVTGYATSGSPTPFPTTTNAFQTTLHSVYGNGFISRIDTTKSGSSSLVYSTFLGGSGNWDQTNGIAVDANHNVYVGGMTSSSDFPLTSSAYQSTVDTNGTGFLTQIDTTKSGSAGLIYSTVIQGVVYGAAVTLDASRKAYVTGGETGPPAYVAKFDTTKSGSASLLYFTPVGGSGGAFTYSVFVDPNGDSYVCGWTWSTNLTVTPDALQTTLGSGGQNSFVTALNPNGSTVLFGSYLGGNGGSNDFASGVALDPNDNIYVVGATQSSNFPTTSGGFQTSLDGTTDGFVAKFTSLSIPSVITSANNVTFIAGSLGSFTVTASGIPGPILSESGSLPSGVTFNTGTGVLSGTPASGTGGSYSITFTASNGVNPNATQNFTLTVDQAPTITSTNTTTFTVGTAGTFTVAATGNPTPTLSESGALPSGVTFTAATGVLAGTPAAGTNGTYPITFTASDGVGSNATQNFTLTVNNAPLPTITSVSRTSGPYGAQVTITGTNFGASQGSSIVAFNGFVAATVSGGWNATTIVALVPFDSSIGNITVTVYGQTATGPTFSIISVATLTDSLGNSSTYNGGQVAGEWHVTSAQGSGCSSCTVRGVNQYAYDAFGNVTSMTDPAGHVTTYTYDSSNDMLTESTKLNSTTTATTTYTYNSFGEPLTVTDPLGNVTMNTYDSHGNLTSVTTPKPDSNTAASVTQFAYNSLGELTTITDPLSHLTTMTYTPAGLIATIKDAQNNITTYGYDSQGNRTSVTDALNHQTTFAYDAMSRLKTITYPDSTSSTTTFAYDSRGRRTSVTDQNGKTTNYAYDDADRLTSVTDAAQHTTYYAYDTEGNLTKITDANSNQTAFTYDAFGRVTLTNFPSSLSENYQYDADNNLTSKTDRKNQTITYVYDALNRLAKKQYPDSTEVDYVYDLVGKIQQVNDPTGTYALAYDSMGRLIGTTTNYSFLTSRSFTNAYTYDAASNRTGFTDPESGSTTYTYDTLNRLTSLAPPSAFGSGSFGFSYDALSRRTQMARPNRVTTNYAYDNLSRLQSVLHQLSGSTIDGASYTLDSAGNRTARTDQRAAVTSNYTYDAIYQLTQVTQANNTTESYTYDPVGNRTASLGVSSYTTNASNELTATSNATYTYDSNGNTLTKTVGSNTTTYAWDFENRLTSVTLPGTGGTVTFKYDPLGRRIEKVSPTFTSVFAYDSASLTEETNASGVVVARYAQGSGIDEPLAEVGSGATSYYEQDGLDSVTSLTNPTGALAQTYTLDSFGKLTSSSGLLTNSFQYTGRESDPETGLYYYRARYYDPQTGRFLNEDPTGFTGGIDLYSYVSNAPTILRDPTGNNGAIVVVGGGAVSVTTTITVTMIGSSAGSAPVLSLIAGGSGGGATAGPIGALVGVIAVVGTYDAIQLHKLCEAYGLCGPDNKPSPPPCNTGRQSKCVPIGYDKQLGGCRYLCDDGRVWFEAGPCKGVTFKPWGDGFPKYPPTPLAP